MGGRGPNQAGLFSLLARERASTCLNVTMSQKLRDLVLTLRDNDRDVGKGFLVRCDGDLRQTQLMY